MLRVAVIADDLTGAADTGIQFCRPEAPTYLLGYDHIRSFPFPESPHSLSLFTNTRNVNAEQAGNTVNRVASALAVAWAMVREKASVITFSPGIPPEHKAKLGHTHAPSIEWAIEEALRRQRHSARLTVLTHSPELLPIGPDPAKETSC